MSIKDMNESDLAHPNDLLKQERIRHNWRQRDIADQLGTTVVTVNRWERGNQQPSAYFRIKLCALFGKNAEELGLVEVTSLPSLPTKIEVSGEMHISSSPIDIPTLWMVPYLRNPCFTGRDKLLHLLNQHFSVVRQGETTTTHRAALTQPQAIKGLGGIGKTQVAVEYAYRAREHNQYTHTLWMNAASKEALMTSFTTLAELLPDFPAKSETNQQKLLEAIKRWLEQCKQRWLLIFDNADDLSLIQGYIPHHGSGNILITTRANAVGSLAISIEVEKMGFIEGTQLLLRRAQRFDNASDEQMNKAGNIVVALDHFPLALEQAGAYIEETGCSFSNYLQLYQNHRAALLARRGAQPMNYPDSVATTWLLSFQKVEQANPAAAELLRLCAFLAPDAIPEELLTDGARNWPSLLQQAVANLFAFNQMIESLLAFSLVKRLTENHLLSIPRLVQVVQMDMMDPEEQRQWATRVVTAMNRMFPPDPRNVIASWPQCLRYLDQAQVCVTFIQQWDLLLPEGADLLERTGIYLYEHSSYAVAEPLFLGALRIRELRLGLEHPLVASALKELATLYRQQGKYTEAEALFQRALHIWDQSIGLEHIEAATALNGLAVVYYTQGKYTEAVSLCLRALHIWEQNLGTDHPLVAHSLDGLAVLYYIQGKYAEAEPLHQRALLIREQSLGPEHPLVASSLKGLAAIYHQQGKYIEAEILFQRTLSILEHALEPDHPDIADTLHSFAALHVSKGSIDKAASLYCRALAIREKVYGQQHPKTIATRERLHIVSVALNQMEGPQIFSAHVI